jgi:hypothetical protein
VIAKVLLAVLAAATLLTVGAAAGPRTAMAHDCQEGRVTYSHESGDHGHDGNCPTPRPVPAAIGTRLPAPPQAAVRPPAPAAIPADEPADLAPPAAPAIPTPARTPGPNGLARTARQQLAGSESSGGSWLPLALGSLAALALLALIRAGFRARRELEEGLDARWPGA